MQYNNKLRTIKLHFITITKYLEINHIQFMLITHYIILSLVLVLHSERHGRGLGYSRQSDDDNFPVPERCENVRVSLGEADGLYGELEGEGGDQVDGVEVPHAQVAVLVSVQNIVVAGQQA